MKSAINFILVTLFLVSSCQKEPFIRFGFDTDFDKYSQGISIMNVNNNVRTIILEGDVFVSEGEVLVELIAPSGETVFSRQVNVSNMLHVNESFDAMSGNWKLRYRSMDGEGSIILHLNFAK